MLSYCETVLFPVGIYLFIVNNKNTRKWCEISPKLTKNLPKKSHLQDLSYSDIHSSSCEESYFTDSDPDSPGNEMWIKCGFSLDYLWLE